MNFFNSRLLFVVTVEAVFTGHIMRVQLKGAVKHYILMVQFTGIQVPSIKTPDLPAHRLRAAQEAKSFTESSLLQRDVLVLFEGLDGDLFLATVVTG